jgi:8-oxo-dGTP diphosphatase
VRRLFLIRHAHRDVIDPYDDNALSERGHEQATQLATTLKRVLISSSSQLFSSPRLRCIQTLTPLSDALGVPIQIDRVLADAADGNVEQRVRRFLGDWLKSPAGETWIACSHGDWLPEFFHQSVSADLQMSKAQVAVVIQDAAGKLELSK